jgi:hypothetical protein
MSKAEKGFETHELKHIHTIISSKLREGFVFFFGEISLIQAIEKVIYANTNEEFMTIILPGIYFYLGKKNRKLKELLNTGDITDTEWENLLSVTVYPIEIEGGLFINITTVKPDKKQTKIEDIGQQIKSLITGLEVI